MNYSDTPRGICFSALNGFIVPACAIGCLHGAFGGYDANHDGVIEYVPGEAGAMIAYLHGQFMTSLVLAPAS